MSTVRRLDNSPRPTPVTSEILDRQPPSNPEAELGVLGSILHLPHVCDDIALILRPDDFYDDANRTLFEQMLEMHDAGRKIDITLLVDRLKKEGVFDKIGGASYLANVSKSVPHAAHGVYYANIVREKATYRALIDASTEILRDAYDEAGDSRELLSQSEQKIFSILDNRSSSNVANIREVLNEALDRLDARMRGEHTQGGVDTGFVDLDKITDGLHNSELVILAARPSMGKTALALNIAANVAIRQLKPTLLVSLEMSSIELADRMLCSEAKVNGHRLRNGSISNEDRGRWVAKASEVSNAPLFIDDSPSRTVTEISAAARRLRRREGNQLGLIVIDYLQLIEPDNPKDPRQEQVAKIARRLKGLAREIKVPVLCLAQLNRQAEEGKDHRPRLSQLRESGAIEQDADVVMFIHREEYFQRGKKDQEDMADFQIREFERKAEIIVAKQRNGPTDDAEVVWLKDYARFEDKALPRQEAFDDFNQQAVAGSGSGDEAF